MLLGFHPREKTQMQTEVKKETRLSSFSYLDNEIENAVIKDAASGIVELQQLIFEYIKPLWRTGHRIVDAIQTVQQLQLNKLLEQKLVHAISYEIEYTSRGER